MLQSLRKMTGPLNPCNSGSIIHKSAQNGLASITFGGFGWRTADITINAVTLANARLLKATAGNLYNGAASVSNFWYCYFNSTTTIRVRAYVGNNLAVNFGWGVEEFSQSQSIQRGQSLCFAGGSTGARTQDVTITALPDYTKAGVVIFNEFSASGEASGGTSDCRNITGQLTSNTNLRIAGDVIVADATGFYISWEVYPLNG